MGTLDYNLQNKISKSDKKSESIDLEKKIEKVEDNQSYLLSTVQDIQGDENKDLTVFWPQSWNWNWKLILKIFKKSFDII